MSYLKITDDFIKIGFKPPSHFLGNLADNAKFGDFPEILGYRKGTGCF